jgi:hypothetical protein
MGLLDFFRRRAGGTTGSVTEQASDERAHAEHGAPGLAAEGPPVGMSDPGSLTGDDAGDVAVREENTQ